MGNIIPALPFGGLYAIAVGVALFAPKSLQWVSVPVAISAMVAGRMAIDRFGFWETERMRKELEAAFNERGIKIEPTDRWVGISWKGGTSPLDAHLDVGFLRITPTGVKVLGELSTYEFTWEAMTHLGWTVGVHSIIGLGGWCTVQYDTADGNKTLKFEVREQPTMRGNKPLTKELVRQLWQRREEVRKEKSPAEANSHRAD